MQQRLPWKHLTDASVPLSDRFASQQNLCGSDLRMTKEDGLGFGPTDRFCLADGHFSEAVECWKEETHTKLVGSSAMLHLRCARGGWAGFWSYRSTLS